MTYYDILGVDQNASIQQIRAAYHQKALLIHPDRNHEPTAKEKFQELGTAYETLANLEKKRLYDEDLLRKAENLNDNSIPTNSQPSVSPKNVILYYMLVSWLFIFITSFSQRQYFCIIIELWLFAFYRKHFMDQIRYTKISHIACLLATSFISFLNLTLSPLIFKILGFSVYVCLLCIKDFVTTSNRSHRGLGISGHSNLFYSGVAGSIYGSLVIDVCSFFLDFLAWMVYLFMGLILLCLLWKKQKLRLFFPLILLLCWIDTGNFKKAFIWAFLYTIVGLCVVELKALYKRYKEFKKMENLLKMLNQMFQQISKLSELIQSLLSSLGFSGPSSEDTRVRSDGFDEKPEYPDVNQNQDSEEAKNLTNQSNGNLFDRWITSIVQKFWTYWQLFNDWSADVFEAILTCCETALLPLVILLEKITRIPLLILASLWKLLSKWLAYGTLFLLITFLVFIGLYLHTHHDHIVHFVCLSAFGYFFFRVHKKLASKVFDDISKMIIEKGSINLAASLYGVCAIMVYVGSSISLIAFIVIRDSQFITQYPKQ